MSKFLFPQKPEKWAKMMSQEENLVLLSEFLEKGDCRVLVVYANQQGQLTPSTSFPNTTKTKVVCACARGLVCMCMYISWRASDALIRNMHTTPLWLANIKIALFLGFL